MESIGAFSSRNFYTRDFAVRHVLMSTEAKQQDHYSMPIAPHFSTQSSLASLVVPSQRGRPTNRTSSVTPPSHRELESAWHTLISSYHVASACRISLLRLCIFPSEDTKNGLDQ